MKHLMLPILMGMMMTATGCAELSAIRQAAVSELNAEIISEETAIYRARRETGQTLHAEAATSPVRKGRGLLDIAMLGKNGETHEHHPRGRWE